MKITDIENNSLLTELTPEAAASIQGGGLFGTVSRLYLGASGVVVGTYFGGPVGGAVGVYLGNQVGQEVEKSSTATGAVVGYIVGGPVGAAVGGFIGSIW